MTRKRDSTFVNRELSWLEFNQRVLDEALNPDVPLLERVKFLAITCANLDEFFMVRVGGLQLLHAHGVRRRDKAGLTPRQQLIAIADRAHRMAALQDACWMEHLAPALAAASLRRLPPGALDPAQRAHLENLFDAELSAIVTPMAVHDAESFPLVANLGLHLAARLAPEPGQRKPRFAVVPLGRQVPRFVPVPTAAGHGFVLAEDALRLFAERLFPGERVRECTAFRVTRNADLAVEDEFAPDLLAEMEAVLARRKASPCLRLEVEAGASRGLLSFLKRATRVPARGVYQRNAPLDLSAMMELSSLEGHEDLRNGAWSPQPTPLVDPHNAIFGELSRRDVLLCHPYDSFDPVLNLIEAAADDPEVLAIKQVLYRTSRRSPVIAALRRAAEAGKYVTTLVELKARFDEARNIEWARELEQAGVQVIYGVKGLKTHAKVCIVVRREPEGLKRYVHFGTGNYNETTARLYTDISYLTTDPDLAADASSFFNAISGYSQPQSLLALKVAPVNLRETLEELIRAEAERKRQGQPARILAKMNSLEDPALIGALYDASAAGVEIKLNVRGICCLRPGVPGLSESISVVSIVDRFLEHSRIAYFHHGGSPRVFISSADWMPRNLDRRVELLVPVKDKRSRKRVIDILETCLRDNVKACRILSDGGYEHLAPGPRRRAWRAQERLYRQAVRDADQVSRARRNVFEPHQPPIQET